MKKSIAMKWVKALRSGKYKQTKNRLKDQTGHCCLGVLCTLTPYKNNYTKMSTNFNEFNTLLPNSVKDYVGMKTNNGKFYHIDRVTSLATWNDRGKSFAEIADIIEQYWEKL